MKHIPRFFVKDHLFTGAEIILDEGQSHQITSVLRLNVGQKIYVFNSCNGEYLAELTSIHKKKSQVHLIEKIREAEETSEIHLFFAHLKTHRTEFILEKGTELGVTHFHPCLFDYSMIRSFKIDKAQHHCIQAAQQCGRLTIPLLNEVDTILNAIKKFEPNPAILCHLSASASSWKNLRFDKSQAVGIIVGPEGGMSERESTILMAQNHISMVSLGPAILRAETAALAALSGLRLCSFC